MRRWIPVLTLAFFASVTASIADNIIESSGKVLESANCAGSNGSRSDLCIDTGTDQQDLFWCSTATCSGAGWLPVKNTRGSHVLYDFQASSGTRPPANPLSYTVPPTMTLITTTDDTSGFESNDNLSCFTLENGGAGVGNWSIRYNCTEQRKYMIYYGIFAALDVAGGEAALATRLQSQVWAGACGSEVALESGDALGTSFRIDAAPEINFPPNTLGTDGTLCTTAADVSLGTTGSLPAINCADDDGSTIEGVYKLSESYFAGSGFRFAASMVQTAAETNNVHGDVDMQCRGDGDTLNTTYGTPVAVDLNGQTGSNGVDRVISTVVTPNGTCAANDLLVWRYQVDATGTTATMATNYFTDFTLLQDIGYAFIPPVHLKGVTFKHLSEDWCVQLKLKEFWGASGIDVNISGALLLLEIMEPPS